MHKFSLVVSMVFLANVAAAQQPMGSQTANTDVTVVSRLVPTLQFPQDTPPDVGIDDEFQLLPQALSNKNDKAAAPSTLPSGRVSGYILNRQLVEQIARVYPVAGVDIGQGWNSFLSRSSANICIEGDIERLPGTSLTASISAVENSATYFDSISGSAGGSYGPFSGSGSYLNEKRFSSYDANVVMNAVVDMGGRFIKPSKGSGIRLTEDALRLLRAKDGVSRFLQACGDSFVTSIREGGRLSAVLSISKVNQSRKEEIQAQAAGGFSSFSANASFKKTAQAAADADSLKVLFDQIGGVFGGIPVTFDEMVEKFTKYKVDEKFDPRPYVFFTQNYRSLPNWPDNLENRVSPVDQEFFVLSYYNFNDLGSDYDKAIKDPNSFKNFLRGGAPAVSANRDIALKYARNLDLALWECINSFDCSIENLDKIDSEIQSSSESNDSRKTSNGNESNGLEKGAFSGFVTLQHGSIVNNQAQTPAVSAESATDAVVLPKMTVSYYSLLASLPLYESGGQTGFAARSTGNQQPSDEKILQEFRVWLVATRLRPIANGYCTRSANHPLCLSGKELSFIVGLIDIAPDPLRPKPTPIVVPPKPVPKPEVKPTPKKPQDPIDRGPCRFRPMICT